MVVFVVACIIFIAGIVTLLMRFKQDDDMKMPSVIPAAILVVAIVVTGTQCFYTQDAGDVKVLIDFGGNIAGSSSDTGIHFKAPWQSIVTYDIRNNVISFVGDGEENYVGGSAEGPQVTINDSSGTQANIDIQVNYSLDPSKAIELYENYGTQENFVQAIAAVDTRAIPREVAGQFDTLTVLTNRGALTDAIEEALKAKWEPLGLTIEQISVQEVRYPESITTAYANAQQVEVERQQAENQQAVAEAEAETRRIEAEGEANANRILTQSLTSEVLQQQYIEALKSAADNGSLIVVPEGSQPIVGTTTN